MDADAFLQHNPTAALEAFAHEPFAMAEDAGQRRIELPAMAVREQSSSVMVFGGPQGERRLMNSRRDLVDHYRIAWHQCAQEHGLPPWLDAIREQRAWSVVGVRVAAPLLPRPLNWSRFWQPNPRALIHHAHGPEKWTYRPPAPLMAP